MKLPCKIIALDLETTDSDARIGDIIQIGAVIVNEDLSLGETFMSYVKPFTDHRNPKAMECNQISEETLQNAPHADIVFDHFRKFCQQVDERPILASWGAYFDISFLKETYRRMNYEWCFSYRSIDLKTIAIWELAKRDDSMSGGVQKFLHKLGLEFEGTPHDGLDDIINTMRIIQKLK